MREWWRGSVVRQLTRLRLGGRSGTLWSLRITVAAVASYVAALMLLPTPTPLLSPLTAMLVVQVTPWSLLASGLDRVVSVVLGVGVAIGVTALVSLTWWSLGLVILVSLLVGQALRLRDNLLEVPISAMLVMGVGSIGAETAAGNRVLETLVGAGFGVLVNLAWPPRVASADAGTAIDDVADSLADLLREVARDLEGDLGSAEDLQRLTERFLGQARMVTYRVPDAGAALLKAEQSRRLNVRAVGQPDRGPGLRQGLEALEHTAVSVRSLLRAFAEAAGADAEDKRDVDPALAELAARVCRSLADTVDAFGQLVADDAMGSAESSAAALAGLRERLTHLRDLQVELRARLETVDADRLETLSATLTAVRRVVRELDPDERLRRQVRLSRGRKSLHVRVRRPGPFSAPVDPTETSDEDAPTEVIHRPVRPED
jgi:hypothetical protein